MLLEKYKNELLEFIDSERDYEKKQIDEKIANNVEIEDTLHNILYYKNPNNHYHQFLLSEESVVKINKGDLIVVSDENLPPLNSLAVVKEKTSKFLTVDFKGDMFKKGVPDLVKISLYLKDSEYNKMKNVLKSENSRVRKALSYALNILSYPQNMECKKKLSFYDNLLDESQKKAVEGALNSEDFFLIHGPFGTGKTRTIIEIIKQELDSKSKILVSAESNKAIDNIVERLTGTDLIMTRVGNEKKISNNLKEYGLNAKIKNHNSYKKIIHNQKLINVLKNDLKEEYNDKVSIKENIDSLYERNNLIWDVIKREIVNNSQIILTTNSSAAREEILNTDFDLVIIDEASQTTIPRVLIPISKAERFILVGDHKQLPPTILNDEGDEYKITLFEKLIENYPNQSQMLNIQYRMNEELMDFPNKMFYDGKLMCASNVKNNYLVYVYKEYYDLDYPLVFINTFRSKKNKCVKQGNSYYNELEANLIIEFVKQYLKQGINYNNIGVITPYKEQVYLIRDKFIEENISVFVDTVDSFQGNQKDIILISNVRSNDYGEIGFLNDKRRLNVSLTRAKKKLIIIGDIETLRHEKLFDNLIGYCKKKEIIHNYID